MTQNHPDTSEDAATLSDLLVRVGGELDALATAVGDMQVGLGPLLVDVALQHPDSSRHAQSLDLVWQTLGSLARVTTAAGQHDASRGAVNLEALLLDVPLADLAKRLRGAMHVSEAGGDVDLF